MKNIEIGIDLGTTNSVVAYLENGNIEYLRFRNKDSLASTLFYELGKVTLGDKATNKAVMYPEKYISSSKASMGDSEKKWKIEEKEFTPTSVATEILKEIKRTLEKKFKGLEEIEAIITVPAYFKSRQNEETEKAAVDAGLKVKQIITEPIAAAVAYGFEDAKNQKLFIVDIGGGTFDTAILEVNGNNFKTLAYDGDSNLGGDDFTNYIAEYIMKFIRKDRGVNLSSLEKSGLELQEYRRAYRAIMKKSEEVKIELSEYDQCEIEIPNLFEDYNIMTSITRDDFEEISTGTINEIKKIIEETINDSRYGKSEIDKVILVGGSSKIPVIREFVSEYFGKMPYSDKPLDKLVAMGAAILCKESNTIQNKIVVEDIISHSLGIELIGETFSPILKKNQNYPLRSSEIYTTTCDYQEELSIRVFEGEDTQNVNNNFYYDGFLLSGIENAPRGVPKIKVTFEFDENKILKVTAQDINTNVSKNQEIKIGRGV